MSTITDSPSPNKKNPDWSFQVKTGRGRSDVGAHHRAIDVASKLFEAGVWDGRGLLIVHEAYDTHSKMQLLGANLVEGTDFEFGEDSLYRRVAEVETADGGDAAVEIDGREWRVEGSLTTDELQRIAPKAAEGWQHQGIVAKHELRRPRGRTRYVAYEYQRGGRREFSRPWRGSLLAN